MLPEFPRSDFATLYQFGHTTMPCVYECSAALVIGQMHHNSRMIRVFWSLFRFSRLCPQVSQAVF